MQKENAQGFAGTSREEAQKGADQIRSRDSTANKVPGGEATEVTIEAGAETLAPLINQSRIDIRSETTLGTTGVGSDTLK